MTRPELTPGKGGGKPAKPNPYSRGCPTASARTEPEPEVTSVTPMVNIVSMTRYHRRSNRLESRGPQRLFRGRYLFRPTYWI